MTRGDGQPCIRAHEGTVSQRVLRALLCDLDRLDPKYLSRCELDSTRSAAGEPSHEGRVAWQDFCRLCEIALDLTGDPAFGLHWVERVISPDFGPLAYLALHAASLSEALDTLDRLHPALSDTSMFSFHEHTGKVVIRPATLRGVSEPVQRVFTELVVAGMMRLLRLFERDARVDSVSFTYRPPSYCTEYERVFEGPVQFDQPRTELVFDAALMPLASPFSDAELYESVRTLTERRIRQLARRSHSYAERVRLQLLEAGKPYKTSMRSVARAMGLGERTLRRRLADEGTHYDEVANHTFASMAKAWLIDRQCSIEETACELGFTDRTGFHRAFKRWTGTTPALFKRAGARQASS